jgi:ribosomal protein S18 acetylase RimI-like enzyme
MMKRLFPRLTDLDRIADALDTNAAILELGNEVFDADGARLVRNRAAPDIRVANHVAAMEASSVAEIDTLLARVEREFDGFPHRMFHADFRTPPAFEARMLLEGYERGEELLMLLEGELRGTAKPFEIKAVDDDATWEQFHALQRIGWREFTERVGRADEDPAVGERMFGVYRAKSPPLRYWLACDEGTPAGHLSSWEGRNGVGQVEDLAVIAEHRHRGIATALLHHCVADARAHGAKSVVLNCDPTDTPKQMYAAMGWRPVAVGRRYRRMVQ